MELTREPKATTETVREQLLRILSSRSFLTSHRSQAFLRFVVEKSLTDHTPKEYEIAVEVLERRPDYDPAVDATVRVEAGRLRKRLCEYYSAEGNADPLVIDIPKGGYAAAFRLREPQISHFCEAEKSAADNSPPVESARLFDAQRRGRRWRPGVWGALAAAFLLVAVGIFWFAEVRAPVQERIRSLAVLPLESLSRNADQEYFADGMTDALIAQLARIPNLRVVSGASVMRNKGDRESRQKLAGELKVQAVLEGSVVHSGNRVRITARLIEVRSGRYLWAQSFEEEMNDPLTLQDKVAGQIAAQTVVALTAAHSIRYAGCVSGTWSAERFLRRATTDPATGP